MSIAVLILGMHRSGTSATAGALRYAGVDFGSNLMSPREDNPRGFFEHDDVWQLHQRLLRDLGSEPHDIRPLPPQWLESAAARRASEELFKLLEHDFESSPLWGVKDPRLSRLFPLWPAILQKLDAEPRLVLTLRHPLESARSIVRRDRRDLPHALGLWLRYTLDAELATRGYRRVVQHYPELLADPCAVLLRTVRVLDLGLADLPAGREREIRSFLDTELRHQRAEQDWLDADHPMPLAKWCDEVYRAMLLLPDAEAAAKIDRVAASLAELESQAVSFSGQIADHIREVHLLRTLEIDHRRLSSRIGELDSEHKWLSSRIHQLESEHKLLVATIQQRDREHMALSNRVREQELRAERAEARQRQLEAALAVSQTRIETLDTELRKSDAKLADAQHELETVYRSRSWRVTRPMRAMSQQAKVLRASVGPLSFLGYLQRARTNNGR